MSHSSEETEQRDNRSVSIILGILVLLFCCVAGLLVWQLAGRDELQPTPAPTVEAPGGGTGPEDAWERIQASGKMVVGTSAEYPPFEYYNANYQLEGFDIALIQEIGRRLGLQIELEDMAFDGLGNSLQLDNIDVAIAAITVTSERDQVVDFTNTYFISEDTLLAQANSPVNSIDNVEQIVNNRVGVERGTVYENWFQTTLVDTGQMPASNLFIYESAADAVRDLSQARLDYVALDLQPAQAAVTQGGTKIVAQGLNTQQMAIAIGNGQTNLQSRLNSALTDMINDGTVNALVKTYMNFDDSNIVPLPTATSGPTVTPQPTATAVPCIDDMSYVADLSFDDENMTNPAQMPPGWPFSKGWRVRNNGTCTWNSSYSLQYDYGNTPAAKMGGEPVFVQGTVQPGQTYDFWVNLVSPLSPGVYQAFWQMHNAQNVAFGSRVWVGIEVVGPATATPAPTQTPVQNISFTAEPTSINQGQCTTFTWSVTGANAVYFYESGEPYQQNQVPPNGSSVECPPSTTVYELRVEWPDGRVDVRQIVINVTPSPAAPQIDRFTVSPPHQIEAGQCVVISWAVSGDVTQVDLYRNDAIFYGQAPSTGQIEDCPSGVSQVTYKLVAQGPGGTSTAQETIQIVQPTNQPPPTPVPPTPIPTATVAPNTPTPVPPTPTLVPPPTPIPPHIDSFSANPSTINAGECTLVAWSVSGDAQTIQILRNGQVVLDNAPFNGSEQDCLSDPGTVNYRIEARAGELVDTAETAVTVNPPLEPDSPLTGTSWKLNGLSDGQALVPVLEGTEVTATFDQSDVNGSSGCNTYGAPYQTTGSNISFGPPVGTNIICGQPEGIMDQEHSYLALLGRAATFEILGQQLLIRDANGQTILDYESQPVAVPLDG